MLREVKSMLQDTQVKWQSWDSPSVDQPDMAILNHYAPGYPSLPNTGKWRPSLQATLGVYHAGIQKLCGSANCEKGSYCAILW